MTQTKKSFTFGKREIGFLAGIVVFFAAKFLPLAKLSDTVTLTEGGQTCLALTLACVVWWAMEVAQAAYVGGIYCVALILFKVVSDEAGNPSMTATISSTFGSWTKATMWLIIGAYLIAEAVRASGLGERIAYAFMLKFVKGYKSLIISIFVLTFILAILIPHPFPRAFMILAVIKIILDSADYGESDRAKLGFLIFAASVPCSMFFLTGDSTLNPLVSQYSADAGGTDPTYIQWFIYMSVPMLVASAATLILALVLFKPGKELSFNRDDVIAKQKLMGKITPAEIKVIIWIAIAICLWLTVSTDYIGWVTLLIGLLMSMPLIGGVLHAKSWSACPLTYCSL